MLLLCSMRLTASYVCQGHWFIQYVAELVQQTMVGGEWACRYAWTSSEVVRTIIDRGFELSLTGRWGEYMTSSLIG